MADNNQVSWRQVEETDFLPTTGWLQDEVADEFSMFREFITPTVRFKELISVGSLYRNWREYRGSDVDYSLSVNDLKRLWTAMAILHHDDPMYGVLPDSCILYDASTRTLVEELQLIQTVH